MAIRTPGRIRRLSLSLALACVAAFGSVAVVSAYTSPGSTLVVTQSCSSANQATTCHLAFRLLAANGSPEANATVTFSVTGVSGATVTPTSATTDAAGNVLTAFSAGLTGCGTATITASSPPASAQTTVNVPCNSNGGLPNTSASPPTTPTWLPFLAALALMIVAGSALALRRMRVTA